MRIFRHSVVAPVPAKRVWSELQEPETWAAIGGVDRVSDVRRDPTGGLVGYRFSSTIGGVSYRGEATTLLSQAPDLMKVRVASRELTAQIQVELTDVDGGTLITVTVGIEPRGLIATLAFPAVASAVAKGLPAHVEAFASRLAG